MLKQHRQGDILFIETGEVHVEDMRAVEERFLVKDGVIALGETTGHAHRVVDGEFYRRGTEELIVATDQTRVTHEEHDAIELEQGVWLVRHQREYVSEQEERRVYD